MTQGIPVCIECGGPVNALNEDESGSPCPACSERLLETLPGVFHAPWGAESGAQEPSSQGVDEESAVSSEGRGNSDTSGDPRGSA